MSKENVANELKSEPFRALVTQTKKILTSDDF
jgi:hypothetical protein